MATIYNSQLQKEIREATGIQVSRDKVPSELAEKVIPVIDVSPKHNRVCNIVRQTTATNSTGGGIYTAPAGVDFYLTSCSLTVIKDATSTSTSSHIDITVEGTTCRILNIVGLTLTADTQSVSMTFPIPIKIDRGTSVSLVNATNAANISTIGSIAGFTVENSLS